MEGQKRRVAICIDGSNFYFKIKSLGVRNLRKYDYRGLCDSLTGGRNLRYIGYYIGVVRAAVDDAKSQELRINQVILFNHLLSPKQRILIRKGYLMKNDGVYHEKGVDVKIATDLLVGAYENLYDDAIVISSDTDLLPAIHKVKEKGKTVEYIGFCHQPALALQAVASKSKLLSIEELKKYE